MTEETVTVAPKPDLPPPSAATGPVAWLKENLFSSPLNIALTIISLLLLYLIVPPLLNWIIVGATWVFPTEVIIGDRSPRYADCGPDGACWLFVRTRIEQFIFGFYPETERWRVILSFILGAVGIYGLLGGPERFRRQAAIGFFVVFPILSFWLLRGGLGLLPVPTSQWGGFMLTLVIALVGIVLSLPFGILLALGRRSNLPIVHLLCVIFIEFVRGVPLITVIFMANIMLPLFLPPGYDVNVLLRVLVGTTAFVSAYMAEVVRGGLQAIPKGQFEGAMALGLGYWQMMRLIILPQALRVSIPSIVNTFIGFFKDTTLVSMVGLYDFLNMVKAGSKDANWIGADLTGYTFCAIVYWVCCFSMSRYSMHLERKLHTGHKR
ncbi:amino acid ABC transporter permease [Dongia deserti]|uniref:amino acid ABC transporter permease n=1 Tax=Dongia deserti TaxID=2268030 RepID=UPI000E6510C1|nr:amino acid ABC transporter permease [Dongia deserti]